ncbi:sperm-associated antigen 11-like [Leopardus geoffroyi]|uniref:sperm-associated antigen 11-like n=1 Tax=Felis catus TaxID=9685 RepID=UPI0003F1A1C8|nr:sperm-associated antigen 11-like [Felis catus]XP_043413561.1 sperm-associated antigen 11-like [Prionailurus bengalensis]XP_045308001.1 sperm-associated antigen 11-like [Leopardus geoffroyi]
MKVLFLFAVLFYLVQVNSGDIPPGIRDVICLTQHGTCRLFFCHFGEKKAEICSNPWNRCCVPSTEAEISNKPEMVGKKREP